ncbi:MAG: N-acetylglutaminylglutamine amidotransferase [Sneathiella sp.]|uniref:N-acetylglutaminylglutamine amidotransferase n=1 Tax=Sneathiella sp. TaxID=1964365 RepID=UPI000C67CB3B|nr:N-acetylglutaminylglutamine amidotransferase [Sneathiella sp.]MAL77743.1 N-acetylglutaminylglutamine amidotransferase [Sneathiella sp.]
MCGICGEITFDGSPVSLSAISRMMQTMAPRGPDAAGAYLFGQTALGHRRLKIIDLSERSHQPLVDVEHGLSIAFNGCLYNYRDLRRDLEKKGYKFHSDGDTEVILKSYAHWGLDCVSRFQGMFAFAIQERDSGRLILARDRLGIKPLYLAPGANGKRLRFASSLPALLAAGEVDTTIDPAGLHHFMSFHAVVPPPYTILKGVRKLPPATIRVIEPDGTEKDRCYWQLDFARTAEEENRPAEEWQDELLTALRRAVDRRMIADVPVGVLLSGGVDSSLIVGLLAEAGQTGLKTFSVGFEAAHGEKGDEFQYSDLIAQHFGTDHYKTMVPSSRLLGALPKCFAAMSEPMVSYDNIGFYLLSEEVSKQVKVVQSGQGADEIFAGYHWYPPLEKTNDPVGDYAKVFFDRDHEEYARAISENYIGQDYSRDFVAAYFDRNSSTYPVEKALDLDTNVMLVDDPVKRVDNMTMAWGLEARVPFLDHELVELAAKIPSRHKLASGGKGILKDVARRIIPEEVIDRPKGYFPVPALKYVDGEYLELVSDTLNSTAARERGLFRSEYVEELLADPTMHITPLRGSKLWQLATLEFWLQTHGV